MPPAASPADRDNSESNTNELRDGFAVQPDIGFSEQGCAQHAGSTFNRAPITPTHNIAQVGEKQ